MSNENSTKKKPKYGGEEFEKYALQIVNHPAYEGMPDLIGNKGKIQWEAPSNRSAGKFKDTHHLRRDWWRQKAVGLGLDPSTEKNWISKVAKSIHPLGKKPCKSCGTWMEINYCYASKLLENRLRKFGFLNSATHLLPTDDIRELIEKLAALFDGRIFDVLPDILSTKQIIVPKLGRDSVAWIKYLNETYIPSESTLLSPGAMSNAPDRLDGFHSFNRCCRESADTGRTKENLRSYVTDRRTFEYWVDGDWIAADRLMGQVRSNKELHKEKCFNYAKPGLHPQPCHADHIGPISLGFSHRPQFQFLCGPCNSGKNNRMYETDISLLLTAEGNGESVISWFAAPTWDLLKDRISSKEGSERICKILRDNRHSYMAILNGIYSAGHYTFLASLLHLTYADRDCSFENLRAENHLTKFDSIIESKRTTKYAAEQKARRLAVGFQSLKEYLEKENRNAFFVEPKIIQRAVTECNLILSNVDAEILNLDAKLKEALLHDKDSQPVRQVAGEVDLYCTNHGAHFDKTKNIILTAMNELAVIFEELWDDDRYIRAEGAFST